MMRCKSCQSETTLYGYNSLCTDCLGADVHNPEYLRKHPVTAFVRTSWEMSQDLEDPTRTRLGVDLNVQTPMGFSKMTIDLYRLYENEYGMFDSRISTIHPSIILAYPQLAALKSKAFDAIELFNYLLALREQGIVESIDFEYMPDNDVLPEHFNKLFAIYRKGVFFQIERLQKHKSMTHYLPLTA